MRGAAPLRRATHGPMLQYLVFGITFAFAAAIQPGPLQTYLVSRTLSHGWRRTWPAAFAPLISDVPIAAVALGLLHLAPPWLLAALQCAGGLFLLYLAVQAFRAWRSSALPPGSAGRDALFKAVVVNLLNPNPYLGWSLVMGPLVLAGWREGGGRAAALLIAFYATLVATMIGIVLLFGAAARLGPRVNRSLVGLAAAALAVFGGYALWLGLRALPGA